jgi:hypothetical protein
MRIDGCSFRTELFPLPVTPISLGISSANSRMLWLVRMCLRYQRNRIRFTGHHDSVVEVEPAEVFKGGWDLLKRRAASETVREIPKT